MHQLPSPNPAVVYCRRGAEEPELDCETASRVLSRYGCRRRIGHDQRDLISIDRHFWHKPCPAVSVGHLSKNRGRRLSWRTLGSKNVSGPRDGSARARPDAGRPSKRGARLTAARSLTLDVPPGCFIARRHARLYRAKTPSSGCGADGQLHDRCWVRGDQPRSQLASDLALIAVE